jgi:hypothetical protein
VQTRFGSRRCTVGVRNYTALYQVQSERICGAFCNRAPRLSPGSICVTTGPCQWKIIVFCPVSELNGTQIRDLEKLTKFSNGVVVFLQRPLPDLSANASQSLPLR